MKKRLGMRLASLALAALTAATLLTGCGAGQSQKSEEPISVFLWSNALYSSYAPYIQSQLPDIDIQFVVGNNDLDFYKFMDEHGALPDIITNRRFALHDAAELQGHLMDLSTTEEAGAVYDSYLTSFTNNDGSINWLPLCGEVDGFVANKDLFDQYNIPLPTDYDSFVAACQAFDAVGIRGFAADFAYDYTCMEVLQGLSIPELTSMEGQLWRHSYEDPTEELTGLDDKIWPAAFERMEQFIKDTGLTAEDTQSAYNLNVKAFLAGEVAIIRSGGASVASFREQNNINTVFLPYYGQDGEQWLLTYPAFQVALNKDLEKDRTRREQALQVLKVMLSEEGQNILAGGNDVVTYSQNVQLEMSSGLDNLLPLIQQNHLFIRIASNDFFSVSNDVVKKMLTGEYNAQQAYEAFDAQLRQPKTDKDPTVVSFSKTYSNRFSKNGGVESYSVMANSLRTMYGSEVLVAPATSFTGLVLEGDYSEKMVGYMIMPNALDAWQVEMTGEQLTAFLTAHVGGKANGYVPFNYGSLPTVSGISLEVTRTEDGFRLVRVLKDGQEVRPDDTFRVTCVSTAAFMGQFLSNEALTFVKEEARVRKAWTEYIKNGGTLAEPESYITVQ